MTDEIEKDIYALLRSHGRATAMSFAPDKATRRRLDIAAAVAADEDGAMSLCHAGFALTCLPHKDTALPSWRRHGNGVTLLVEAGRDREDQLIGLPFGAKARMILVYLQTQAVRTNNPEIELGSSMRAWMEAMGLNAPGGKTYRVVGEQARRLSACRLTFFTDKTNGAVQRDNGSFVDSAIDLGGTLNDPAQGSLWPSVVRLNPAFFRSLVEHPVPVAESALRAIGNKSLAIDTYVWLAYRLHVLDKPTPISWPAIHAQFGAGNANLASFKQSFLKALADALAAYDGARVDADSEYLTLYPSRPPIARLGERLGRN